MAYVPVWRRGLWLRRKYEVTEEFRITPVPGSAVLEYDPQESGEGREPAPLLKALVRLDPKQPASVEAFCSRFGPLGLLHEEFSEGLFLKPGEPLRDLVPHSVLPSAPNPVSEMRGVSEALRYYNPLLDRAIAGDCESPWERVSFSGERSSGPNAALSALAIIRSAVVSSEGFHQWPQSLLPALFDPTCGVVRSRGGNWSPGTLTAEGYGRDGAGRPSYQTIHEERFWDAYAEHFYLFAGAVRDFQNTATLVRLGESSHEVERVIDAHLWRFRMGFELVPGRNGGWRFTYRAPSLLGVAYWLLGAELTKGRLPRPCGYCGKPFIPVRSDAEYCSRDHKLKAWRRANPVKENTP